MLYLKVVQCVSAFELFKKADRDFFPNKIYPRWQGEEEGNGEYDPKLGDRLQASNSRHWGVTSENIGFTDWFIFQIKLHLNSN